MVGETETRWSLRSHQAKPFYDSVEIHCLHHKGGELSQLFGVLFFSCTSLRARPSHSPTETYWSIPPLCCGAQWQDKRQRWNMGGSFWESGNPFPLWGWPSTAQVAQTDGGVSLLAGIQKLSRHCPGQMALDGHAKSRGVQLDAFQRSLPIPAGLWFWMIVSLSHCSVPLLEIFTFW